MFFCFNKRRSSSPPLEGGVRGGVLSTKISVWYCVTNPPPSLPIKGGGIRAVFLALSFLFLLTFSTNVRAEQISTGIKSNSGEELNLKDGRVIKLGIIQARD